ncbi:MAG: ATP-binding protein, partial [Pseudomonadota bacterium]
IDIIFAAQAAEREVRLTTVIPHDLPLVSLDRNQIEQVLINVVKNAIEAIGDHGTVQLTAERSGEGLVIRVIDNGGGLTTDSRANLFVPFYTSKNQGQGLGLTLVREVLTQHGFAYSLTSEQGKTCFEITIPI